MSAFTYRFVDFLVLTQLTKCLHGFFLAKIDRQIVDRALAVPLVNLHLIDFVSARVHGYVANPILGLIADQVSLR